MTCIEHDAARVQHARGTADSLGEVISGVASCPHPVLLSVRRRAGAGEGR
jgi:hypothetical protein